jgi:hypothetical protein
MIYGWLKRHIFKSGLYEENKAQVHPTVGMSLVECLYYGVDEYTPRGYHQAIEKLGEIPILTLYHLNPLSFQIGDSNVSISPGKEGGLVFHHVTIVKSGRSIRHPNGFVEFNRHRACTFDEAFESLNKDDQERAVYYLDIFTEKFLEEEWDWKV